MLGDMASYVILSGFCDRHISSLIKNVPNEVFAHSLSRVISKIFDEKNFKGKEFRKSQAA